ncbi:unnamed protein product [Protopolystoma xenopodis]|uniref:Uncharacterized protein n=1 Tax=Protopolystoma xenopodis TaxID=117903 RepID=A0A3S5CRB3_9PLAT|nr:unnamed protein product [Protopolystoma xenopodis]
MQHIRLLFILLTSLMASFGCATGLQYPSNTVFVYLHNFYRHLIGAGGIASQPAAVQMPDMARGEIGPDASILSILDSCVGTAPTCPNGGCDCHFRHRRAEPAPRGESTLSWLVEAMRMSNQCCSLLRLKA